jgi:hypothetical protein
MNRAILSGLVATSMMVGCGQVESEIDDAVYEVLVPHYWRVKGKCTGVGLKNDVIKGVSCNLSNLGAIQDLKAQCVAYGGVFSNGTARMGGVCTLPNGGGNGDPHMFSPDGLRYDQQAKGEFVFATDHRTFTIQVREEQWGGSRASVQTAVSVDMNDVKVGVYARETPALRINGAPAIVPCASQPVPLNGSLCNGRINFDNGGWLVVNGNKISIYLQDEVSHLDVWLNGGVYMNTQFFGGPALNKDIVGIIGNMNANRADDFQTRDGIVLPQPVSFNDLYRKFADSWRIHGSESTFDYAKGQNTQSFTDFAFPGKAISKGDIAPNVWAQALDACKAANVAAEHLDDCAMDAAIMGNDMAKDYVMPLRSLF